MGVDEPSPQPEMDRPPGRVDPDRPTPELLLWAYRRAVFPMADPITGRVEWFSPDPRGIIPLDGFRVSRNLARAVRQRRFAVRTDTAFEAVMRECGRPRSADDMTWIDERLIQAYTALHERGNAHSVEAWLGDALVGGLYGVQIGGAFFGESMFVRPDLGGTDASKICLVHLVRHMRDRGFTLLDTQFHNDHLDQFGCVEIARDEYGERLQEAMRLPVTWEGWRAPDAHEPG